MPLVLALACSVVAAAQTPVVSAVVNAASYSDGPVSPGAMVVVFGDYLGPAELVGLRLTVEGKVSTDLSGVRVEFDGAPSPIVYVSKFQLSVVVPYSVAGSAATEIRVQTAAGISKPYAKLVAPSGPGLFTSNASGTGQGAIVNADGSLNGSGFRAATGSAVSLFLTGVGLTEPAFGDGALAAGIARAVLPVSVSIGGIEATVLYAGAAPGTVSGFAQVNVTIPNDLQYGGDLTLGVRPRIGWPIPAHPAGARAEPGPEAEAVVIGQKDAELATRTG